MAFTLRMNGDGRSAIVRRIHRKIQPWWTIRNGVELMVFRFTDSKGGSFYPARFRPGQKAGTCLPGNIKDPELFKKALEGHLEGGGYID